MIEIKMPRLSDTMEEGAISTWRKQPGDTVAVGDVLVEIETDKAVMEYEAYEAGTLAEILVPEGSNADIGAPIALLDDGAGGPAATAPAGCNANRFRRTVPAGSGRPQRPGRLAADPGRLRCRPARRERERERAGQRRRPPDRVAPGAEAGQGESPRPLACHRQRTWWSHHPRRHRRPAERARVRVGAVPGRRFRRTREQPDRRRPDRARARVGRVHPRSGRDGGAGGGRCARVARGSGQPGAAGDRPTAVRQRPGDPALLRDRGRRRAGPDGPAGDAERAARPRRAGPRSASTTC